MNIITNNCLGGFIYRDILKEEYKNPFIWTRIEYSDFLDIIENFDNINFQNMIIDRDGNKLSNNFITVIDDKYRIRNKHIKFSAHDAAPKIIGNDVYYNKPWEYITEKYFNRIKRMKKLDAVAIYEPDVSDDYLYQLINVCKKQQIKCIIITNKKIKDDYAKIIQFSTKETIHWEIPLEKQCAEEILDYLKIQERDRGIC